MFLFLIPLLAIAQPGAWGTVQKLTPGAKVEVRSHGDRVKGVLVSVSEGSLVLRDKRGERTWARDEIREVKVRSEASRWKRGILGTAIGAAAGLGLTFAACPNCINDGDDQGFILQGAGWGAIFGAGLSFPFPGYKSIYKAP